MLVTEGGDRRGFCDFYCQVGPKLAARLGRERDGAFLKYVGPWVEEDLIWQPMTPDEVVEEGCGMERGVA